MSSEFRVPQGPPWDVDVVADVHAGVYPAELTAELLRTIAADAEGAAILAALDSTVDELSLLPPLLMPEQYVLRLDSALAALSDRTMAARTTTVTARAGIGALLQQSGPGTGVGTAPPGLPRPQNGSQPGARTGQQTSSPGGLPRQTGGATDRRPMVPPRHGPVIPRVLPGGPHQGRPATAPSSVSPPSVSPPSTTGPSNEATRPSSVTDLQSARDRAGQRPAAPVSSGSTSTPPRVGSLEAQRTKRRRWTGGLLAAAAVVAIGGITTLALTRDGDSTGGMAGTATSAPVTVPTQLPTTPDAGAPAPQALVLEPGRFGDQLDEIEGKAPAADTALQNPTTYISCLAANDITPADVTGVTEVTYEGQEAYAIAVDASATTVRIVVVGTDCGQGGNTGRLADQTVTR